MIKKYYKWIIGIIILLLVIFSVVRYNKKQAFYEKIQSALQFGVYKEQTFNRIDIETTNMVANRTDRDYLDSIVYVGLNELNLDSVAITIRQISPDVQAMFDSESQLNTPRENNEYGPMFWWENTDSGFVINKKFKLIY